jgi:hypothetical protein
MTQTTQDASFEGVSPALTKRGRGAQTRPGTASPATKERRDRGSGKSWAKLSFCDLV